MTVPPYSALMSRENQSERKGASCIVPPLGAAVRWWDPVPLPHPKGAAPVGAGRLGVSCCLPWRRTPRSLTGQAVLSLGQNRGTRPRAPSRATAPSFACVHPQCVGPCETAGDLGVEGREDVRPLFWVLRHKGEAGEMQAVTRAQSGERMLRSKGAGINRLRGAGSGGRGVWSPGAPTPAQAASAPQGHSVCYTPP